MRFVICVHFGCKAVAGLMPESVTVLVACTTVGDTLVIKPEGFCRHASRKKDRASGCQCRHMRAVAPGTAAAARGRWRRREAWPRRLRRSRTGAAAACAFHGWQNYADLSTWMLQTHRPKQFTLRRKQFTRKPPTARARIVTKNSSNKMYLLNHLNRVLVCKYVCVRHCAPFFLLGASAPLHQNNLNK